MTEDEKLVFAYIQVRQGKAKAIPVATLEALTEIPGARIRAIVRRLIIVHKYRIGTSLAKPPGFYMIRTRAEADETIAGLLSRIRALRERMTILAELSLQEANKQIMMELGK